MTAAAPWPSAEMVPAALPELAVAALAAGGGAAAASSAMFVAEALPLCVAALRDDPISGDVALVRLAARLALTDAELMIVALLIATDTDPEVARTVAEAQVPLGGSRPLVGLGARCFASLDGADPANLAAGAAAAAGLLELGDEPAALPERSLALPLPVLSVLRGGTATPAGVRRIAAPTFPMPEATLAAATRRGGALLAGPGAGLVVRVPHRGEGIRLAFEAAQAVDLLPVEVEGDPAPCLGPWLIAAGAVPLFTPELGPGGRWRRPAIVGWDGPWIALAGPDGAIEADPPPDDWTPPASDVETRRRLWLRAGFAPDDAMRAAGSFRQGPGRIAEVATRARTAARLRAVARPCWDDLRAAAAAAAPGLEPLARRVPAEVPDDALVLPDRLREAMAALVARAQVRDRLHEGLGPAAAARARRGLAALFAGESGTGKTLAAHWFADRLGLPLHRVDLAALTSKWIGETEKNLGALFSAADHADAVLFFDEADALFASRTEVSDAHDRHANAQTNYLLQRIEAFDGVAILASNSRERFDPAFVRRLDAILEFPLPGAPARAALWQAHLGRRTAVTEAEIDRLALAADLAGGHIRNVVLAAAAVATAAHRPIAQADLWRALDEEHIKLGRPPPGRS